MPPKWQTVSSQTTTRVCEANQGQAFRPRLRGGGVSRQENLVLLRSNNISSPVKFAQSELRASIPYLHLISKRTDESPFFLFITRYPLLLSFDIPFDHRNFHHPSKQQWYARFEYFQYSHRQTIQHLVHKQKYEHPHPSDRHH